MKKILSLQIFTLLIVSTAGAMTQPATTSTSASTTQSTQPSTSSASASATSTSLYSPRPQRQAAVNARAAAASILRDEKKEDEKKEDTPEELFKNGMVFFFKKDYTNALASIKNAAEKGLSKAQHFMGFCCENNIEQEGRTEKERKKERDLWYGLALGDNKKGKEPQKATELERRALESYNEPKSTDTDTDNDTDTDSDPGIDARNHMMPQRKKKSPITSNASPSPSSDTSSSDSDSDDNDDTGWECPQCKDLLNCNTINLSHDVECKLCGYTLPRNSNQSSNRSSTATIQTKKTTVMQAESSTTSTSACTATASTPSSALANATSATHPAATSRKRRSQSSVGDLEKTQGQGLQGTINSNTCLQIKRARTAPPVKNAASDTLPEIAKLTLTPQATTASTHPAATSSLASAEQETKTSISSSSSSTAQEDKQEDNTEESLNFARAAGIANIYNEPDKSAAQKANTFYAENKWKMSLEENKGKKSFNDLIRDAQIVIADSYKQSYNTLIKDIQTKQAVAVTQKDKKALAELQENAKKCEYAAARFYANATSLTTEQAKFRDDFFNARIATIPAVIPNSQKQQELLSLQAAEQTPEERLKQAVERFKEAKRLQQEAKRLQQEAEKKQAAARLQQARDFHTQNPNSPEAQTALATCYLFGIGTDKNDKEAVTLLTQATEKDHAEAQRLMGCCYEHGFGVRKNEKTAIDYYRRAAAQQCVGAINALGHCYECFYDFKGSQAYNKSFAFLNREIKNYQAEREYAIDKDTTLTPDEKEYHKNALVELDRDDIFNALSAYAHHVQQCKGKTSYNDYVQKCEEAYKECQKECATEKVSKRKMALKIEALLMCGNDLNPDLKSSSSTSSAASASATANATHDPLHQEQNDALNGLQNLINSTAVSSISASAPASSSSSELAMSSDSKHLQQVSPCKRGRRPVYKPLTSENAKNIFQQGMALLNEDKKKEEINYRDALNKIKKAANAGHVEAQYTFGFCLEHGIGWENGVCNKGQAFTYYQKAAKQNHEGALRKIRKDYKHAALSHEEKAAVTKHGCTVCCPQSSNNATTLCATASASSMSRENQEQCLPLIETSTKSNYYTALKLQYGVGNADGHCHPGDKQEAVRLYREAANNNYAYAQFSFGFCKRRCIGRAQYSGSHSAEAWFDAARESFQNMLGDRQINSTFPPLPILLQELADQTGDPLAWLNLGICYHYGIETKNRTIDLDLAKKCYTIAASTPSLHPVAQRLLTIISIGDTDDNDNDMDTSSDNDSDIDTSGDNESDDDNDMNGANTSDNKCSNNSSSNNTTSNSNSNVHHTIIDLTDDSDTKQSQLNGLGPITGASANAQQQQGNQATGSGTVNQRSYENTTTQWPPKFPYIQLQEDRYALDSNYPRLPKIMHNNQSAAQGTENPCDDRPIVVVSEEEYNQQQTTDLLLSDLAEEKTSATTTTAVSTTQPTKESSIFADDDADIKRK